MSSIDLFQLYCLTRQNSDSFDIVISPRMEGIKLLCVHLSNEGMQRIKEIHEEAMQAGHTEIAGYVIPRIQQTPTRSKFYCQIPFKVSGDRCHIVDLRFQQEVVGQLQGAVSRGISNNKWQSN